MAEHAIAVLVDFENMARPGSKSRGDFDIQLVLNRLAEKGRVLVKRAYADWSRYREAKHDLQNAGLELIEMPSAREGAKNRADIKLAVDAMELAYSRDHLDNFVIVSGDSDFTPLVGKLRELNKRVTGVGNRESSSELLIANCDEFIFYDLLASTAGGRTHPAGRAIDPVPLLRETLTALQREGVDWPLASVVKDSMRRKYPAFDESDHGYSTFSKFLAEAGAKGMVRLETDPRSGTYRVELADGRSTPAPALPQAAEARADDGEGRRRRRRRRGEGPANGAPEETALEGMPADAEVFEIVVTARPEPEPDMTGLPPIGEPISYEDMIMLGPELDSADVPALADVPDLAEASDVAAEAARPAGRRRRRTREPLDVAEIADADRSPIEAAASAEAAPVEAAASADAAPVEAAASADAAPVEAEAPVAAAVEAEAPPTSGRRRVRRRSSLGAVEEPAVPRAEALPAPAAAEPQPIVAEPEAPAAAEAAPASPRRRARRSAAAAAPEAEAAPAPAPPDEAVAEPAAEPEVKPTPRRRTRKAAAEEEPTAGVAVPEEADAAPAEDAPAPRKRRSRAKPAEEAAAPVEPAPEPEVKPTPRRRTRKAAAEEDPAAS